MICPKCRESISEKDLAQHERICASKNAANNRRPSLGAKAVRAYRDILSGTRPGDIIALNGCPNILHGVDGRLHLLR